MARVHRSVIGRLAAAWDGNTRLRAAVIDTPYGFQENAAALSDDALDFFGRRLGLDARLAALHRADVDVMQRELAYAAIREADFVFSGPGSPSYALAQWSASEIPTLFADKLLNGGALVVASAAALTLGRYTAPIYEIYKAGEDPRWLPGLDVLSAVGINATVVPHWDNAEGTSHDTRFCFLGERRFTMLEHMLPDDVFVLGIDEHTALVVDFDYGLADVRGRGSVTLRRQGEETVYPTGSELRVDRLGTGAAATAVEAQRPAAALGSNEESRLARDMVVLQDTTAALRTQAALVEPLVDELLALRNAARAGGDYATADRIRARLTTLGLEISDASDGTTEFRLRG